MSGVNFLEKLLGGVEVEWKPLGELGNLVRGNGLQKKDFTEKGVPAIHYGQIYTYYGLSTNRTKSFVSPELAKQLKKVNTGDVVITNTSENIEDVGKALLYLGNEQAVTGGHATIFKPGDLILGKYFVYFTQSEEFSVEKRKLAKGTKVIDVSATDMAKIKTPIPCPDNPKKSLEIQAEIVRILDAMTAHTAELTAELTARKKQYNYYRDKLLSFEDGEVEWRNLGEVATVTKLAGFEFTNHVRYADSGKIIALRGLNVKGNLDLSDVKYIDGSNFSKLSRSKLYIDDMLFTYVGTVGSVALIDEDDKYYLAPNVALIRLETRNIIPRYMFYYFQTSEFRKTQIDRYSGNSSMQNLTMENIRKFKIAIPSLSEQARIVAMLDKFDALTTSITEGLPREIELRQKQYAYYRDLLLSFPKPLTI